MISNLQKKTKRSLSVLLKGWGYLKRHLRTPEYNYKEAGFNRYKPKKLYPV